MLNQVRRTPGFARRFHTFSSSAAALVQRQKHVPPYSKPQPVSSGTEHDTVSGQGNEQKVAKRVKRNEVGVQMLSRELHSQIFRNLSFPAPKPAYVRIAQEHLQMHGLDPKQGSVLPDTGFTLPPLLGQNIDEHFHRIGTHSAEPWLSLARGFASIDLPPKPDCWDIQSGWTKYHFLPDGSSYSEHVDYPQHNGKPEEMLAFDVETMPPYHPFAIMACAASEHAWYSWISPWLLGESSESQHLIPFGNPNMPRVVVGHNVSYDRGRILEEYSLHGTQTRFLDTMALHVAVKGISSHQRPAWMKHRKSKEKRQERQIEAVETAFEIMRDADEQYGREMDINRKEELLRLRAEIAESLPQLQADDFDADDADISNQRWEDLTSANSLADVAKLHCNIDVEKEIRNDFMKSTPAEIVAGLHDYLNYCSQDVSVTHAVFAKVLPAFLIRCPSPVSFAGILTMGSSFLTVNQSWEAYLNDAERTYKELDNKVKNRLVDLAKDAKEMMTSESWKENPWLAQLDWTPKVAGKSRGVLPPGEEIADVSAAKSSPAQKQPAWYRDILRDGPFHSTNINRVLPLLLQLSFDGVPLQYSKEEKWHYVVDAVLYRLPSAGKTKTLTVLGASHGLPYLQNGRLASNDTPLAIAIAGGDRTLGIETRILELANSVYEKELATDVADDPWLRQLDWKPVTAVTDSPPPATKSKAVSRTLFKPQVLWPKWYWDLAKPKKDMPPGTLDITVRNRIAPILLRLSWLGWPLFHSREHGWTFRVQNSVDFSTRLTPLEFYDPADDALQEASLRGGFVFYKLPHKDGEKANVGNPLSKMFMKFAQDGTLTSPGDEAKDALDMNAQCSYWISARDRILNQLVVWQNEKLDLRFEPSDKPTPAPQKWGIILPQVITMGTVTRRAIEKTWLTASNAKKNRVGSELKAMVRAPPGYAIVGADVDSEELWISSCMGDAQFGLHGATAIGWMTLEGTKAAGTDLHSKTASILGISRDQAKVFNYSRIYGAGMRHAVLLLLQSNGAMLPEQAQKLAENLYSSTKGKNTHRSDIFGRKFWFGGTESFVFNKLEEIALSDRPQTPALGCGITAALSKEHLPAAFGSDYMTSRINWVVQSSGVDYLHLLIVAMDHLIRQYNIQARYLISVHDELRYLVVEEDRYRAALALQIANLWTRSLFAYKLGMDDLPQGVAFFSAVDVDTVLRKEVDMPCVTPSHPNPIPPGESLDITRVLEQTNNGSLWRDGSPMAAGNASLPNEELIGYQSPDCLVHRAESAAFLRAQATSEFGEVKHLAQQALGKSIDGGIGGANDVKKRARTRAAAKSALAVEDLDWEAMREVLKSGRL
ncbi:DNA polymerase family A-domain-containing protein [Hygrophoropsis aurantiaca]|uniref:DNA polymerase family A-domain-containing protein n=1 Tax=Hygrophoropsis aurantiaca TaxID=72124 RepID=A0ACB8A6M0_9AGAM|nr:DNA polymerase family A-domain-containing protein [Hygrophoropsis aurantiaca]